MKIFGEAALSKSGILPTCVSSVHSFRESNLLARLSAVFIFLVAFVNPGAADELVLLVDISDQSMKVSREGVEFANWPISTGTPDHRTPTGSFRPIRIHETWRSIKYDGIPMPYSIFFLKGYAIHGTLDTRDLGRPASRGCIRLHPANAKALFNLVAEQGMSRTRIIVEE